MLDWVLNVPPNEHKFLENLHSFDGQNRYPDMCAPVRAYDSTEYCLILNGFSENIKVLPNINMKN